MEKLGRIFLNKRVAYVFEFVENCCHYEYLKIFFFLKSSIFTKYCIILHLKYCSYININWITQLFSKYMLYKTIIQITISLIMHNERAHKGASIFFFDIIMEFDLKNSLI